MEVNVNVNAVLIPLSLYVTWSREAYSIALLKGTDAYCDLLCLQ